MHNIKLDILESTIQWSLVHLQCCITITCIYYQIFITLKHHSQQAPAHHSTLPAASGNHQCVLYTDWLILNISWKWNYTICDLLCLASFTQNVFKIHLCYYMHQYFIPFHGWIITHCMNIVWLIYPSMKFISIWAISIFQLLWIVLQWTYVYMCTCINVLNSLA